MNQLLTLSRKRWWLTAGLLAAVTILGLRFGIPYYRTRAAIAAIKRAGGTVRIGESSLRWVRPFVGDRLFQGFDAVIEADLNVWPPRNTSEPRSLVACLAAFPRLRVLKMGVLQGDELKDLHRLHGLQELHVSGRLCETALQHVSTLGSLQQLYLTGSQLTGDGLASLSSLDELRALSLQRASVDDSVLDNLKSLQNLKWLCLNETGADDAALSAIAEITTLEELHISDSCVTDQGVAALIELPNLWRLELNGNAISDRALESIAGMSKLRFLGLANTQITDAGIRQLAVLKDLQQLRIYDTAVTQEACDQLQRGIPALRIRR